MRRRQETGGKVKLGQNLAGQVAGLFLQQGLKVERSGSCAATHYLKNLITLQHQGAIRSSSISTLRLCNVDRLAMLTRTHAPPILYYYKPCRIGTVD